jgi:hypothetical protein
VPSGPADACAEPSSIGMLGVAEPNALRTTAREAPRPEIGDGQVRRDAHSCSRGHGRAGTASWLPLSAGSSAVQPQRCRVVAPLPPEQARGGRGRVVRVGGGQSPAVAVKTRTFVAIRSRARRARPDETERQQVAASHGEERLDVGPGEIQVLPQPGASSRVCAHRGAIWWGGRGDRRLPPPLRGTTDLV